MAKRHSSQGSQRSLVARIEERILASSGADAFELVFTLVAARLASSGRGGEKPKSGAEARTVLLRRADTAAKRWPGLDVARELDIPDDVLTEVVGLLERASLDGDAEGLDSVFEQLVTRVGKGDKGQFFTPRHVVDWTARALLLRRGERVLDPACGSGAFLVHARAAAPVKTWGFDVDARAVRVARLIAVATGDDPVRIARCDSLRREAPPDGPGEVDAILTNPPFAGDVRYPGYAVANLGRRAERDALFLERCVELLRPGGRLAIVLPHNKIAARGWGVLRRWLVEQARVFAVVSLPRETFLPHTAQKAAVLFAKRRLRPVPFAKAPRDERTFFALSEKAGKDAAGEPLLRAGDRAKDTLVTWRSLDHDLDTLTAPLTSFLTDEGFAA